MSGKYNKETRDRYFHTVPGLVKRIHDNQLSRSIKKGFPPPEYTYKELLNWVKSQSIFNLLFKQWVDSGYTKELVPSVDRKNDHLHYTIDNIQLMSWSDNNKKGKSDRVNGINTKLCKTVEQLDLDGNFIASFHSESEAARRTNGTQSAIGQCCAGGSRTSGGFKWRYGDV